MPHKLAYQQPIVTAADLSISRRLLKWITHFLAIFGLLLIGLSVLLYLQGQRATRIFDEEFIGFFGEFVVQIMKTDMASAMLIKIPLEPTITIKQTVASLKKYAEQLNLKLLASYPLHQELEAVTGKPYRFMEVFQFCDAQVATTLLNYNPDFAFHLPYRIILYQDAHNQLWLATLNLNLLLHGTQGMDPNIKIKVLKIQDNILKMMGASAHGA
ncbi:hypothetical protein THII_1464 [Thioploca ingrica]|uniref:DUF302 domain-containing protein n=1 Tax=Thioploca ingrica TaxID=40754 RepID=A0A090BUV4_9GAMM|nr:hypothetical protein THII_1464 [Thioploca ingrica]